MSVLVTDLSKMYGTQQAVNHISFEVQAGQILAFLGPNGAGKTTTMKMLTCFIPPSGGKATVCGFDTVTDSLEVRRRIGYLPEHNPLYKDMYVHEYLQFVAQVRKVDKAKARIASVIEETGLGREQHKLIGQLSKGYRQRVGLASAILHDPEVLILDEPTSGLDPNQLVEIRELIRKLGTNKTVIFSSHILAEVEQLCNRVVIINQGNIVADDTLDALRARAQAQTESVVWVEFENAPDRKALERLPGVRRVVIDGTKAQIYTNADNDIRAAVSDYARNAQLNILEMRQARQSTEDIFRLLTQTAANKE